VVAEGTDKNPLCLPSSVNAYGVATFPHRGKAWLPLWGSCRRRRLRGLLSASLTERAGCFPPHPPPFPRFLLAQPSITAVPLPPSSGTSASVAGSLPAEAGKVPDVVHFRRDITNVTYLPPSSGTSASAAGSLPASRGRGTIAMIGGGFVCFGGDGGGGCLPSPPLWGTSALRHGFATQNPLRHRLRGATSPKGGGKLGSALPPFPTGGRLGSPFGGAVSFAD
jgi:hypothetical protein